MILWGFILIAVFIWKRRAIKNYFGNAFPKDFRFLIFEILFGLVAGIVGAIFDLQGKSGADGSDGVVAVGAIAALALIILAAAVMAFRKNKPPKFWGRFAFNSIFFAVGFFPGVFVGFIGIWSGVILILGALAYFAVFAKGAGGIFGGGNSASQVSYQCCNSCSRYNGACAGVPNNLTADPLAENTCSDYIRK